MFTSFFPFTKPSSPPPFSFHYLHYNRNRKKILKLLPNIEKERVSVMSFAHFDEINKICRENAECWDGFPEGVIPEVKIREEETMPPILRSRLVPRFQPVEEDEAVYMVKYGQLV